MRLIGGVALNAGDRIDWALQEDSSIWGFETVETTVLDNPWVFGGVFQVLQVRGKVERKQYAGEGGSIGSPIQKIQEGSCWDVQYLFFPLCQMKHVG